MTPYLTIFAVVAAITILWWVGKRQRRQSIERSLHRTLGNTGSPHRLGGKVSAQTRHKLLKLLGNHQPTVDRLIDQARWKNPGESEQWYWEKVLYDLERDRWR
jgi:hypothetical protein